MSSYAGLIGQHFAICVKHHQFCRLATGLEHGRPKYVNQCTTLDTFLISVIEYRKNKGQLSSALFPSQQFICGYYKTEPNLYSVQKNQLSPLPPVHTNVISSHYIPELHIEIM